MTVHIEDVPDGWEVVVTLRPVSTTAEINAVLTHSVKKLNDIAADEKEKP